MALDPHINPATGVWDDNYYAQNNLDPTRSGGGGGYSQPDYAAIAREQMKMMQEANAPAIASLQASIPETQAKYAAEKERIAAQQQPLEQRYQNLLSEVTRQQNVQTTAEQTATSREFGRRGISLQSGLFDQTLNQRLKPISEWAGQQSKEIGLSREDALTQLQNLINQTGESGIGAVREIQNAIANLQAGGNQSAIQSALGIYNAQQQAAQVAAQQALQQQQLALQQRAQDSQLAYAAQTNPLELELLKAQIKKANSTGGGGSNDIAQSFYEFRNKNLGGLSMDQAISQGYTIGPAVYK